MATRPKVFTLHKLSTKEQVGEGIYFNDGTTVISVDGTNYPGQPKSVLSFSTPSAFSSYLNSKDLYNVLFQFDYDRQHRLSCLVDQAERLVTRVKEIRDECGQS